MAGQIKDYQTSGVGANVQLGVAGNYIDGSNSSVISINANAGGLAEISIANGTLDSHAVTLEQLRAQAKTKLRNDQFIVHYNDVTKDLAVAQPNTFITSICVEASATWTGANSSTNITIGDSGNHSRLFSAFDPLAQSIDETDYEYANATTLTAYVTPGSASAGNAIVTVWYFGELTDPSALTLANLVLNLDASDAASYSGSGSTWFDLSGNGNNGTITGAGYNASPISYFSFNGTGNYVSLGQPLPNGSSFSFEAWIYPSTVSGSRNIISSNETPFWISNGTLSAGVDSNYSVVTTAITANSWYHVVATFDDASDTMTLYVNNVQASQNTSVTGTFHQQTLRIGAHEWAGNPASFFDGYIAEARVYDAALSAAEVQSNFDQTKAKYGL